MKKSDFGNSNTRFWRILKSGGKSFRLWENLNTYDFWAKCWRGPTFSTFFPGRSTSAHTCFELPRWGGGKQSTFGTNPHLLSDFEVKVDKIHFWGKKSTLALFSAILGVKVDFSFWHLNPLIHYFEKILGSKWKKSTFGTFKIFEKF